ncbi:MAG: ABC transporter permease [Muribaculaceae bacterium]|nr:ABC transporter permease [Muribaculaceae bacterium]
MIKQLIKQTLAQLRSQRMLTAVSIIGSALSIFLIMVVVMLHQVQVAPFAPVSNRPRMLHADWASMQVIDAPQYCSNGPISEKTAKSQFGKLTIPEAVTICNSETRPANLQVPGSKSVGSDLRGTDEQYWTVFDFTFIDGKPYNKADVESKLHVAVIDRSTARLLFGTEKAAGREFLMNYVPYTVAGVVRDVSVLADGAFSHVWVPYTSFDQGEWLSNLMGSLSVTILAKSPDDFDAIRAEYERNVAEYNKEISSTGWEFITRNRPYDQEKNASVIAANLEPDEKADRRTRWIIYAILLIVPAINLSGMTESRMRRRVEELGVRRAFGCTRAQLLAQLFSENLLITILSGLIGWLASIGFAFLFSNFLFSQSYSTSTQPFIELNMLVQPSTFGLAMLFCFILNFLSSSFPAWKASRANIVNAINKH